MFSASNDARLLNKLNSIEGAKIDGFVSKGEPGVSSALTAQVFLETLGKAIGRAKVLKDLFKRLNTINDLVENSELSFDDSFKETVKRNTDVCYQLTSLHFEEPKYLGHAYLQLFYILEELGKTESLFEQSGSSAMAMTRS